MTDAFYIPDGDGRFKSTEWTIGPWDPRTQHGGPPAALLGRALERAGRPGMQVARATFEILRPVPVAPLQVTAEVVRPGNKVELVAATLTDGDNEIIRASAWRIRTVELGLDAPDPAPPPSRPEDGQTVALFPGADRSYLTAMEWSFTAGNFLEPGPATAWARMRLPLVSGEDIDPLSRVLVLADSGSGISSVLDFSRWLFVNPDLSVYLHRMPTGEWVCLDAVTIPEPTGIGLAASVLYDETGSIGRGLQTLFIGPRQGP